jgi:MFS transporter, OFA family, oxalate/formate antiporter
MGEETTIPIFFTNHPERKEKTKKKYIRRLLVLPHKRRNMRIPQVVTKTTTSKILVVVGAILVTFGCGSIYCWGTLSVYVSSPGFYENDGSSKTSLCYAVATLMEPFSMFLGALCERRITPRLTAFLAGILIACGWILSMVEIDVAFLIFSFGILCGLGTGAAFVCALTTPLRHFDESSHGLLSGLILSAFSIGSLSFALTVESVANPDHIPANYYTDGASYSTESEWEAAFHASAIRNVPRAMAACAAMSGFSILVGSIFLSNPSDATKENTIETNDDSNGNESVATNNKPEDFAVADNAVSPKEMMQTVVFWQWYIAIVFFSSAELYITRAFSEFVVHDCDFNIRYDLVGGCGAIAMIAGRFAWGKVCDAFGYRQTIAMCSLGATVVMLGYFETTNNKAGYVAATILLFFLFAGGSVSVPSMVAQSFGKKHFATNYSIIVTSYAIASILQAIVPSLLLKAFGSHRIPFYFMSLLCASSSSLTAFS